MEIKLEEGFAAVRIDGTDYPIDLYKAWALLDEIRQKTEGQPTALWGEVQAMLTGEFGIAAAAKMSHYSIDRFIKWHGEQIDALKKAGSGEAKPASPDSTVPTSSTAPPAES